MRLHVRRGPHVRRVETEGQQRPIPGQRSRRPKRYHVLGGDLANDGRFNKEHVNYSHPFDGSDPNTTPDDGWIVHLDNISTSDPRSRRASALGAR